MQYTYYCKVCIKTISAIDLIVPDYVKCRLPVYITNRSGVDLEVLNFIINGATTSMSFSSMKTMLSTNRIDFYQSCMLKYYTALNLEEKCRNVTPFNTTENSEVEVFSNMDDPSGFNDVDTMTENYIREVFREYISDRKDVIEMYLQKSVVHPVQSMDHTFSTAKKTIKISKTSVTHTIVKDGIANNGLLFMMGGDGKVTNYCRTINTQGVIILYFYMI